MSTRSKFEKVAQLIAICKTPMLGDIINNLAKEVEEQFDEVLKGNEIMVSWSVDDIQSFNDDNSDRHNYKELSVEDARNILYDIERCHDTDGITWTTIETSIDYYNRK